MTAGIIIGSFALLLILLVGWIWRRGRRAKAELVEKHPPPGRMVDLGGYRLHINCQGSSQAGSPTVVIDAASGEFSLHWAAVQQKVAEFTRVCTYDRAGMGWSDRSRKPYTAMRTVEELHTLLMQAGVEPPYVLVGHSLGGLNVRLYAHEHPDQVAGLVLVDPAHEEQLLRSPEGYQQLVRKQITLLKWAGRLGVWSNSLGLLALYPNLVEKALPSKLPEETHQVFLDVVLSSTKFFEIVTGEMPVAEEAMALLRAMPDTSLGDRPLIVLSAGMLVTPDEVEHFEQAGRFLEDAEQVRAVMTELQAELAALSSNGEQIIAAESGHNIYADQPELVVDAIRQVVQAAQCQAGSSTPRQVRPAARKTLKTP